MWAEAVLIAWASLIAGFCSGLAGFAFVLVAAGILLHFVPPTTTAPVLVLGSLLSQLIGLSRLGARIEWPRLGRFIAAALAGMPIGILLLAHGSAAAITSFVGSLLVVYASYMLARLGLHLRPPRLAGGKAAESMVGFASGILGGLGGFVGALPAMWGDIQGWPKERLRALMQPFIIVMQALTAAGLAWAGFFTTHALLLTALAAPALLIGTWLGLRLYLRLSTRGFRVILLGLLLLSGISLLV